MLINLNFVLLLLAPLAAKAGVPAGLYKVFCKRGVVKEQSYLNGQVALKEMFFKDAACTQSYLTFETRGEVEYEENFAQNINFTYKKIFLTLENHDLVENFNSRKVCGFSDWQINQKSEITGLDCAIFNSDTASKIPSEGEMRYGIYLLKDNRLYYGKMSPQFDSSTREKRPESFDLSTEYIFQNPL